MRFIIYGAGGIGGSIGARLFLGGQEVVLIARGEHFNAIQKNGLRFVSPRHDEFLQIPAVDHPRSIDFNNADVVILCMKGQHTESALDDLQPHAAPLISVVCCQNGVANERAALRRFSNVYGMCVLVPAEHLEPGVVVNFADSNAGALDVGRYPQGVDERAVDIANAISDAGFNSVADENVMRHKYSKLLANLNNAVQAACGSGSRELSAMLRNEALACYTAAGIQCATADESRTRRVGINGGEVPGFRRHGGSSLQSVIRNTGDIEADFLNGEITLLGRLHGIPTPANDVVQKIGHKAAASGNPGDYCTLADIERLVDERTVA